MASRNFSSGRTMPTATFQLRFASLSSRSKMRMAPVRMRQIEIGGDGRRDRRRVDLVIGQGFEAVDLEPEGRCRHMTLTDDHRRHGSDLNPDLGVLIKALERRELARRRHGKRDTRAIIGFRNPQMGFTLRLAIRDDIHHNVAAGAAHLVLGDDPVELQRDAELACQRLRPVRPGTREDRRPCWRREASWGGRTARSLRPSESCRETAPRPGPSRPITAATMRGRIAFIPCPQADGLDFAVLSLTRLQ